jgi:hypothetical protein
VLFLDPWREIISDQDLGAASGSMPGLCFERMIPR